MKQIPSDMKHIILTNINVTLYICTLTFRKVVWQQIWGQVVDLVPPFWEQQCNFHATTINIKPII